MGHNFFHFWKYGLLERDFTYEITPGSRPKRDGSRVWRTTSGAGLEARFGHADRAISVIDVRQSYLQSIVEQAYKRAKEILTEHVDQLHTLAKALLEYELLSGDEIKDLLAGKAIIRPDEEDDEPLNKGPSSSVPTASGLGDTNPQGA